MTGSHISIEELDFFQDLFPDKKFRHFVGWRTGLVKQLYCGSIEPNEPRLFHITLIHSRLERFGLVRKINLRAAGSALTYSDAISRAVGETVERFYSCLYDEKSIIFDSYNNLQKQGINALGPGNIAFFSEEQFSRKDFPMVRFTEDVKIGWTRGVSLITGEEILVPAQFIYLGYKGQPGERHVTYTCTSGCACASTVEEAILKGIFEQVERDAVMINWYAKLSPPRFDIHSVSGHRLEELYQRGYDCPGMEYQLRYITLDLPIPAFMGIAKVGAGGKTRLFVGGAANLDPRDAAFKALLEIGQGVPFIKYILVNEPFPDYKKLAFDNFDDNLRYYADPDNTKHLDFLQASDKILSVDQLPNHSVGSIEKDLVSVLRILKKFNMNPIAIDHTTDELKEIGLNVTRIVIPELVQMGTPSIPFLGCKRLFEVPVKLGLKDELTELNPMLHPYP
jgi:ribosomal protein S12 methylthiotransferase accessory factor